MNTAQRAQALAEAAAHFPLLGQPSAQELLDGVRLELGHAEILDGFRPYGEHFARASVRQPLLHIVSGNTPHAALQSLVRGLLLGAHNRIKIPSSGLPEVAEFLSHLPAPLRSLIEVSSDLPADWLPEAGAVIVYGSDETVAHFRKQTRAVFEPHPHRVSLALILERPTPAVIHAVATDISRFQQKGCLSPHDVYVKGDAREFAAHLADAMAAYETTDPRGPVTTHEAAEIANVRANYRFRAVSDPRVGLWESPDNSAWTVVYEEDPWFASSCLNRVVYVKPLPNDLRAAIGPALAWVAAVGVWPVTPASAEAAGVLVPSRICPVGRMQDPPWTWHQEGRQSLAPLVRWVDFETEIG